MLGESADASPTARALLALELLQGSPGITADRLADKLGVSERAARRYVGILREAGIPIESVRGPYGGYRVGRGAAAAAADVQRRRGARPGHGRARRPPRRERPHRPGRQRARQDRAGAAGAGRRPGRGGPPDHGARPRPRRRPARPGTTTALVQACSEHRRVRLGYRSEAGSEWAIEVDPWAVVVRHGRWYLLCRSHRADARRAYRIDRVSAVDDPRRHVHPAGRPRPGRHARGAPRRRLGVRRRGRHRRARSTPWRGACRAPSAGSNRSTPRPPAWSAAPATRAGTPSSSRRSRRRTGSSAAPNCARRRVRWGNECSPPSKIQPKPDSPAMSSDAEPGQPETDERSDHGIGRVRSEHHGHPVAERAGTPSPMPTPPTAAIDRARRCYYPVVTG